jgi:hypothetical protein
MLLIKWFERNNRWLGGVAAALTIAGSIAAAAVWVYRTDTRIGTLEAQVQVLATAPTSESTNSTMGNSLTQACVNLIERDAEATKQGKIYEQLNLESLIDKLNCASK